MAIYKEIQAYVHEMSGFVPKTCWIAHVKEMCGIPVRTAYNRKSADSRAHPCPPDKQEAIKSALEHFGMI